MILRDHPSARVGITSWTRRLDLRGYGDSLHVLAGLLAVGAATGAKVLVVERDNLVPTVGRRVLAITGAVHREESVAGAFVHVELVVLVVLFQFFFCLGMQQNLIC